MYSNDVLGVCMTSHGFIRISAGTTMERLRTIAEEVSRKKGVDTAHVVTGPYGIIAYFETGIGTFAALRDLLEEIHKIEGVNATETWIGLHSYAHGKEIHLERAREEIK